MGAGPGKRESAGVQFTTTTGSEGGITMTELAHRSSNGIDVALLWSKATGRLVVSVADQRDGSTFTLDAPSEKALDVFHHPFAYAA
jgi:hypothetical protein